MIQKALPFAAIAMGFAHLALAQTSSPSSNSRSNSGQVVAHEQSYNTIQGTIIFNDDGTTLTVNGHATGMTPGLTYVSFVYGTGSIPRGTLACLPPSPNNLTGTQMTLGTWLPINSPVRTLQSAKTGSSYTSLSTFATASIRYDNAPGSNGALTPARFVLQTCGRTIASDPEAFMSDANQGDTGN